MMFKGVELYSWKDAANGSWQFALLPGTNRDKSIQEIMLGPDVLKDADSLKQNLSALAVGEQVVWRLPYPELSFPPAPVVSDIQAYAVDRQLELVIAR